MWNREPRRHGAARRFVAVGDLVLAGSDTRHRLLSGSERNAEQSPSSSAFSSDVDSTRCHPSDLAKTTLPNPNNLREAPWLRGSLFHIPKTIGRARLTRECTWRGLRPAPRRRGDP